METPNVNQELITALITFLMALTSLIVSIKKKKKPSLAGACLRALAYANSIGGDDETRIRNACLAVIREDEGDNGKRDWPDARIRQEIQGLFGIKDSAAESADGK